MTLVRSFEESNFVRWIEAHCCDEKSLEAMTNDDCSMVEPSSLASNWRGTKIWGYWIEERCCEKSLRVKMSEDCSIVRQSSSAWN